MFDTKKLFPAALLAFALLVVCLGFLFIGSKLDTLGKQVEEGSAVVAGPLSDGVTIEQVVDIPENAGDDALHLGFQFATYSRKNLGQIRIQMLQGEVIGEHTLLSGELRDNEIVYVSFPDLRPGKARLTIEGQFGPKHNSATVWCRYSSELPAMLLNGELSDRRVDVWFANKTINREEILNRVGVGGLIFLSLVFFAVLMTVIYRGLVEQESFSLLNPVLSSLLAANHNRRLLISVPVSLLAGGLIVLFSFLLADVPMNFLPLNDEYSEDRVPIAPLSKGVVLEQTFEITSEMAGSDLGLGLMFGTFLRENKAKIELEVTQGDKSDRVVFNSESIVDGTERIFVFSPFDLGEATLTISGVNGKGSNSPTIWFEPGEAEPQAIVNGERVPQRLVLFRYIAVPKISAGGNKLPVKWIAVVMIVVFAVLQIRGRAKK